jgi:flagellar biogenesis protein FliO
MGIAERGLGRTKVGGLAGWLLARLRRESRPRPSLALLERISLAPRQSLALVEAEGRRFLVATSADGAPAFYALDERARAVVREGMAPRVRARVSW